MQIRVRGHVYNLYTVLKIGKEKPKLTGKVGTDTQYFVNSKIESKSKHKSMNWIIEQQFKFEKFKFTFEFSGAGAGTHVPLSGPELGTRVPVPPYRVRIRIDQLSIFYQNIFLKYLKIY